MTCTQEMAFDVHDRSISRTWLRSVRSTDMPIRALVEIRKETPSGLQLTARFAPGASSENGGIVTSNRSPWSVTIW